MIGFFLLLINKNQILACYSVIPGKHLKHFPASYCGLQMSILSAWHPNQIPHDKCVLHHPYIFCLSYCFLPIFLSPLKIVGPENIYTDCFAVQDFLMKLWTEDPNMGGWMRTLLRFTSVYMTSVISWWRLHTIPASILLGLWLWNDLPHKHLLVRICKLLGNTKVGMYNPLHMEDVCN